MTAQETYRSLSAISPYTGADGARIQELAGRSNGLPSHSLAVITHPPGTASREHWHTVADEVYFVWSGRGRVQVAGEERAVGPGDTVIIRPGQAHKVWNDSTEDLVLIVTCAPAYTVEDVVWDEG